MKLIHFEVPVVNSQPVLSLAEVNNYSNIINELLPSDVECIFTPFKITWNNEVVEVDGVKELEVSDSTKGKILDFVGEIFEKYEMEYQILGI